VKVVWTKAIYNKSHVSWSADSASLETRTKTLNKRLWRDTAFHQDDKSFTAHKRLHRVIKETDIITLYFFHFFLHIETGSAFSTMDP
jgi:hypothetical protein